MDEILFSLIIPVYNIEAYIAECLESCMEQDVMEAEFICVDDGSPDDSVSVIRDFMNKDSRFRLLRKDNGGLSSARNAGINAARGEWILFLDGDDRLKAGALSKFRDIIQGSDEHTKQNHVGSDSPNHNASDRSEKMTERRATQSDMWDIIVFHADTFPAHIEDDPWFKKTLQFETAEYRGFEPAALFKERGSMPFVWRHAYSAELLKKSGVLFDESLKYGEDVMFPMCVFPEAEGILFTDICLIDYRLNRSGSLTEDIYAQTDRVAAQHIEVIRHAASYWAQKGWLDLYGRDFLNWALKFTLLKVRALPKPHRKERAMELKKLIYSYGLDRYRSSLDVRGKAMWAVYSIFWR